MFEIKSRIIKFCKSLSLLILFPKNSNRIMNITLKILEPYNMKLQNLNES